ncbi:MAG TPA: hypothetical protein VN924_26105 [Bryobacteraceae bacterium]|nr:hypothetical protein [Bryobacteraceae bacterium]
MGLAERELAAIDELIGRKQAVNPEIDYATGWRVLMSERADLMESYRQAAMSRELAAIGEEITRRRTANPKLNYASGWMLLASERSDLITAYNLAAGLQPPQSRMSGERAAAPSPSRRTIAMSTHPLAAVLVPIEERINLKRQANLGMSYGEAWKQVEKENPALIQAYNKAAGHPPDSNTAQMLARNLALIDEQIRNMRQKNPDLPYGDAWRRVEKEFPDLMWNYNDAAGRMDDPTAAERTGAVEPSGGPARPYLPQEMVPQGTVSMSARPLARELAAIDEEIARRRAANPRLDYARAWQLIASERPELIRQYNYAASRAFVGRE